MPVAPDEVRAELTREKKLEIARTCTYFNVRKAMRILGDLFDDAMKPYGIKGTQFSLLVAISLAQEPTVGRLADILAADRTTLTRTLAPLERDGLIESVPGSDRRQRLLRLTPEGEARLAAASRAWEETQEAIVQGMGDGPWESLMKGLFAVHALAEGNPEEATAA